MTDVFICGLGATIAAFSIGALVRDYIGFKDHQHLEVKLKILKLLVEEKISQEEKRNAELRNNASA